MQQSDYTYTYMLIILYIHSLSDSFHYRLLQDIDSSSLCYTIGYYCLSLLCIVTQLSKVKIIKLNKYC